MRTPVEIRDDTSHFSFPCSQDSRRFVRIYAISTTLELILALVLCLTAALLSFFLPSTIANPISEAICETLTRGELATHTYWRQESRTLGLRGIQIVNFGIENCDEILENRMAILGGLALLVSIKFWLTGLVWGYENSLGNERRKDSGWEEEDGFDLRDMKKLPVRAKSDAGRSRRMSSASLTRSSSALEPTTRHGRRKSHSLSHPPLSSTSSPRPRLVLTLSLQPPAPASASANPSTISSPIRPNFIPSSSSSATSTPPPRQSRRSSLPPAHSRYPTSSTPPTRRPTISGAPSRYRAGSTASSSRSRSENDSESGSTKSERLRE